MRLKPQDFLLPENMEDYENLKQRGNREGLKKLKEANKFTVLEKGYDMGMELFLKAAVLTEQFPNQDDDYFIREELEKLLNQKTDISDFQRDLFEQVITIILFQRDFSRRLLGNLLVAQGINADPNQLSEEEAGELYYIQVTGKSPDKPIKMKFNGMYNYIEAEENEFENLYSNGKKSKPSDSGGFLDGSVFGALVIVIKEREHDMVSVLHHEERHIINKILNIAYNSTENNKDPFVTPSRQEKLVSGTESFYDLIEALEKNKNADVGEHSIEDAINNVYKESLEGVKDEILAILSQPHHNAEGEITNYDIQDSNKAFNLQLDNAQEDFTNLFFYKRNYTHFILVVEYALTRKIPNDLKRLLQKYLSEYKDKVHELIQTIETINNAIKISTGQVHFPHYSEQQIKIFTTIFQNYKLEDLSRELKMAFSNELKSIPESVSKEKFSQKLKRKLNAFTNKIPA